MRSALRPLRPPWLAPTGVAGCTRCFSGGGGSSRPPLQYHQVNIANLRARQPKDLLRTDVFRTTPPDDLTPGALNRLAHEKVMTDPSKVLGVYKRYAKETSEPEVAVCIRVVVQLGFLFDPNSFFSSADRQLLGAHADFKNLMHDVWSVRHQIPDAAAPVLLYSLACLEYRCMPLLPHLVTALSKHIEFWRTEVLSLALHSLALLGLSGEVTLEGGLHCGQLCAALVAELGHRALSGAEEDASLQDWSRAAFAAAMVDLYDAPAGGDGPARPALPALLEAACQQVSSPEDLDSSGWAQFFLYQTLYCTDVEAPQSAEEIKRSMPLWIQERLHERWLDSIVLLAQPQGADRFQRDIDEALKRTNTQALVNCSAGRDWDEQHCWFAGFMLEPKIAMECDSLNPLEPGRPRPSGWLQMKARVLRKMGYRVVTMHRSMWEHLTEDQKDEQILRLRLDLGYVHNKDLEKRLQKARQTPHTYKGLESKKKDWFPHPASSGLRQATQPAA